MTGQSHSSFHCGSQLNKDRNKMDRGKKHKKVRIPTGWKQTRPFTSLVEEMISRSVRTSPASVRAGRQ